MKYKKTRKRRFNKAFIPSGVGKFIPPGIGKKYKATFVDMAKKEATKRIGAKYAPGAAMAAALAWDKSLDKVKRIVLPKGGFAGTQTGNPSGLANAGDDTLPYIERDSMHQKAGSANIQNIKQYKTKFIFGKPASSSVKSIARTFGSQKVTVFDSEKEWLSTQQRPQLSMSHGFNQKLCQFMGYRFSPNVSGIDDLFNVNAWDVSKNQDQRAYGMVMDMRQITTISNSNSFFPINFKVSMIQMENLETQALELGALTFNTAQSIQDPEAIPMLYQFRNIDTRLQVASGALCDIKTRPTMSTGFRQVASVGKTFTKKLAPGDTWVIDITEMCGAGIDIGKAAYTWGQDIRASNGYVLYLESWGVPCEAVGQITGSNDGTFLGTSPGYFNMETRCIYNVVNNPNIVLSGGLNEGYIAPYGVRLFSNVPKNTVRFNVDVGSIGNPGEAGKAIFIPLITDKTVQYANPATEE